MTLEINNSKPSVLAPSTGAPTPTNIVMILQPILLHPIQVEISGCCYPSEAATEEWNQLPTEREWLQAELFETLTTFIINIIKCS